MYFIIGAVLFAAVAFAAYKLSTKSKPTILPPPQAGGTQSGGGNVKKD